MRDTNDLPRTVEPRRRVPPRIQRSAFKSGGGVELRVTVADQSDIRAYGFAFAGAPVPMGEGRGRFFAPRGHPKRLEWVMMGEPGAWMLVLVTRGETVVAQHLSVVETGAEAFDSIEILVR